LAGSCSASTNQPALITRGLKDAQYTGEIHGALAEYGEDALDHRVKKTPTALAHRRQHLRTHILAMHMIGVDADADGHAAYLGNMASIWLSNQGDAMSPSPASGAPPLSVVKGWGEGRFPVC
jgi:hypothetical protein